MREAGGEKKQGSVCNYCTVADEGGGEERVCMNGKGGGKEGRDEKKEG